MAVAVRSPWRALALALALWSGEALAAGPQPVPVIAEGVLESGRLSPQWTDLGWAPHELVAGRPVGVELGGGAGLILLRDGQIPQFGGLLLRLKVQPELLESLEIGLDAKGGASFPRVNLSGQWSAPLADGFSAHWVAMSALNPQRTSFDRLVLRGLPEVGALRVELAAIGWTREAPPEKPDPAATAPRAVSVTLDCGRRRPINPMIYGVSVGEPRVAAAMGASARRWGGNISSRYNWKLKSWNTGNDWYFRNVSDPNSESWEQALKDDHARGVSSAFVVPLIGWVAKDDKSCSFPVSAETKQQKFDPSKSGCGNGLSLAGEPLESPPPSKTSVPAPPAFVEEWVKTMREKDAPGKRTLRMYMLDNEPALWNSTHRDVHPQPVTFDEIWQRTQDYARAVRSADPQARIAGFSSWGWTSLFDSATEGATPSGPGRVVRSDRASHGGTALFPWWLSKLRELERTTGERLVDAVDVHFYPQGSGIGLGLTGDTDLDTSMRRIRSVRGLWDPTYVDESWIGEAQRLVPRLRDWIDDGEPGLGIVIGEWNFGAETHISGGLAAAEALGRFGLLGVEGAFHFPTPVDNGFVYWAFRAFRNYDGKGGRFGDQVVTVNGGERNDSSVFASRTPEGKIVLVALNHDPRRPLQLSVDARSCGVSGSPSVWSLADAKGLRTAPEDVKGDGLELAPWTVNVLEYTPAAKKVGP